MTPNMDLILVSAALFFFLTLLVGVLLSLLFDDLPGIKRLDRRFQRLAWSVTTWLITACIGVLVFWTNLRITGKFNWPEAPSHTRPADAGTVSPHLGDS